MNHEDQVSCLELSKKLKKLGVWQESLYMWAEDVLVNPALKRKKDIKVYHESHEQFAHIKRIASAFTVAELLERSPDETILTKAGNTFMAINPQLGYFIPLAKAEKNPSDAVSKMLIWLIENGKVKV